MAQTPSNAQTTSGEMRPLGQTGIEVSAVGIGTWAIGSGWGQQSEDESVAALHRALDLGCRLIDTAQAYGNGQSERVIARVFNERGERVPVATKIPPMDLDWATTPAVSKIRDKYPARYITERCEVSLRNLQTACLDMYQFH